MSHPHLLQHLKRLSAEPASDHAPLPNPEHDPLIAQVNALQARWQQERHSLTQQTQQNQQQLKRLDLALRMGDIGLAVFDWDRKTLEAHDEVFFARHRVDVAQGWASLREVIHQLHPDDYGAFCDLLTQVGDSDVHMELRLPNSDGDWQWFEVRARLEHHPPRTKLALFFRNVAAQRSATSLLRAYQYALDQSAIVAITDRRGNITYVNDTFCEISGYSREELLGQNHRLLKSGQHSAAFYAELWKTVQRGETWSGEICNRTKTGGFYWADMTIVPLKDDQGRLERFLSIHFDITKRKQAEAERLQQLARETALRWHQHIARALRVTIAHYDTQTQKLNWLDQEWTAVMRLAPSADALPHDFWPVGRTLLLHPDDREVVLDVLRQALRKQEDYRVIYRQADLRSGGDRYFWMEEVGVFVRTETSAQPHLLIALQDIDHVQSRETRLRLTNTIAQKQAAIAKLMTWSVVPNSEPLRLRPEILGRRHPLFQVDTQVLLQDWFDRYVSDADRPRVQRMFLQALASQEPLLPLEIEFTTQTEKRYISARGVFHTEHYRALVVEQDVTAFRLAEQAALRSRLRMQLATEAAGLGIWEYDPVAQEFTLDERAMMMLQLRRTVSLQEWLERVDPTERESLAADLHALEPEDSIVVRLIRWQTLDAAPRWIELQGRYNRSEDAAQWSEGSAQFVGAFRDVTPEKLAEAKLQAALAQAQEADRAKTRFLAGATHELRTPLNSLLHFTRALAQSFPSDHPSRVLALRANNIGEEMLTLINDVLNYAQFEHGSVQLYPKPFSLHRLQEQLEALLSPQVEEKGLEFQLTFPDQTVVLDPMRVFQILMNLTGNAIKFTEAGAVSAEARLVTRTEDGSLPELMLRVSDTGTGIKPEEQEQIFRPFVQATEQDPLRYGGSGMGLSTVKNLVELMAGTIELHSRLGEGSTFTVSLPLSGSALGAPSPEVPAESSAAEPAFADLDADSERSADEIRALLTQLEAIMQPALERDFLPNRTQAEEIVSALERLQAEHPLPWLARWTAALREQHDARLRGSFSKTLRQFLGQRARWQRQLLE
jgi:PAS domain S-box-containing protein